MRAGLSTGAVLLCLQSVAAFNGSFSGQERSIAQFLPPSWSPFRFGLKLDPRQDGQCAVSCGGGLCCDVGLICCDGGGCCPIGFYCTAVGCCPVGKTCGASLTPCPSDPSQLLCAGGNCCPPNLSCASHDGIRGCDPPRSSTTTGGTSTGSSISTSTTSTSTPSSSSSSSSSTLPPTTTSTTATSTFDAGGALTFTPTPGLPASPPGITQTTVASDDTSIIYTPSGSWTDVQEQGCNGKQIKRSTTIDSELSYTFNASAVALLVASGPNGGLYEVAITDANVQPVQRALVNGFSATQGCATGFATRGLARGIYTMTVALKAASPGGGSALDVNGIVFWDEDTQSNGGGSGTGTASALKTSLGVFEVNVLACGIIAASYLIL